METYWIETLPPGFRLKRRIRVQVERVGKRLFKGKCNLKVLFHPTASTRQGVVREMAKGLCLQYELLQGENTNGNLHKKMRRSLSQVIALVR